MTEWLSQNWFNAAQTAAIVLSLMLTIRAVRAVEQGHEPVDGHRLIIDRDGSTSRDR
jgi:hypothetical protein